MTYLDNTYIIKLINCLQLLIIKIHFGLPYLYTRPGFRTAPPGWSPPPEAWRPGRSAGSRLAHLSIIIIMIVIIIIMKYY